MQALQVWRGEYVPSSLESLIETIAKESKVTIWIDRRVPKDTRIDERILNAGESNESLESFLNRVAHAAQAAIAILDGVVVICPTDQRDTIEFAYWYLASSASSKLAKQESFQWATGATPESIWQTFCDRFGIQLAAPPVLEHDLWKAYSFDRVPLAAICVCLLSSFDSSIEADNGGWRATKLSPEKSVVKWTYKSDELKRLGTEHTRNWRKRWPQVEISQPENTVIASVTAHRELVRPLMHLKAPTGKPKSIEYKGRLTGDLSGDLEIAIRSIAAKTKIEFYPLPLPPQLASKQVVVQLKNNSLDETLDLVAKASGIQFRKTGNRIEILLP